MRPALVNAEPVPSPVRARPVSAQIQRCGGVQCPPGTCDHEDEVQRSIEGGSSSASGVAAVPASVHRVLDCSGATLSPALRAPFEALFGHDFSTVRIHADTEAASSAAAIQARAYTFGHHVVMGAGQWQPHTSAGNRLLAHELTHVVQQGTSSPGTASTISNPHDHAEHEAERVSEEGVMPRSGDPPLLSAGSGRIHRQAIHNPAFPCHEVSGSVMPGGMDFFGTLVHLAIQQHYVAQIDPLAATEYLIPGSGMSGATGRADIIDSTGGIYEIKPLGLAAEAFEEAGNYMLHAESTCDPAVDWHLGRKYWPPALPMMIAGNLVTSWLAGPGVILYLRRPFPPLKVPLSDPKTEKETKKKEQDKEQPAPGFTPAPARSTTELILEWARRVLQSGEDASRAADEFFREHPELPWVVLGLGAVAIVALVADDATLAGIADDVLVPIIAALMRSAWRSA